MTGRRHAAAAAAALLRSAAVAAAAVASGHETLPSGTEGGGRLLDVPYLPQTEYLCGGAAVAMVLRYWGERRVYPEDFAALVDRGASGIRTDVLTSEVIRRGWQALPFDAEAGSSAERLREQVDRGRPVIALIEVGAGRYHYVVVVAWTDERVIVHDPAHTPFRVLSRAEFERAWAPTARWALLLLSAEGRPPERESASRPTAREVPSPAGACEALVREMVERARAGDVGGAETGLLAAVRLCPRYPAAWRELAGVRFLQSRWAEASTLAARAALLDPTDEQGLDLLATSRFLNDEPDAALEEWNRIGRPSVDLVRVEGARRTRHPVVVDLIDLPPRTLLTPERHGRAARRLRELPSAALTSVSYRPVESGLAEVEAAVVERATLPRGVVPIAATAGRTWLQRELRLDIAAPTGSGELWTAAWRWWEARPRLAFALAVPAPSGLPGVAKVQGVWERQSYLTPGGTQGPATAAVRLDERRRAALSLADWATRSLRWETGIAFDRWAEDGHFAVDAALDARLARDRVSLGVESAAWMPLGSGRRFVRGGVSSAFRSTRDAGRASWLASAGLSVASVGAPFDLWPGAGTGHARAPLLRAHPLLDDGVVDGDVFGRWLWQGTVEYRHPLLSGGGGAILGAVFCDTARAWRPIGDGGPSPLHADVGLGVRFALPGAGGTARVDVARGLRDGRVVLSAGWLAPWPGR
jgi:hypothetical protein